MRERYLQLALPYLPRLLQLVDRNPFSPTYGCFDRAYWHYRTMDFPCGMSQEFVLPLALAYANDYPANQYFEKTRVREIAEASIQYMVMGSHSDGTCDDYFPFERAMGALVFSLYAASEAYQILEMRDDRVLDLFLKRVHHLAQENETGRLSNHQALAALAAYNVFALTGDELCKKVAEDRVELTLSWQNKDEGWFQEYEGADPGYHTCTIDFLAKLQKKRGDESLVGPLTKAVDFAWYFMHPDGSYGGEYGSRNTYHFYPHGFELMAQYSEKAGQIADAFLRSVHNDRRYHNDDDRMTAHYVYNFMQSYDDYHIDRPQDIRQSRLTGSTVWMPGAKIAVSWSGSSRYAVANLSKGGVVKVFDEDGPIASDTGIIAETQRSSDGSVLVSHLVQHDSKIEADVEANEFSVAGYLCKRKVRLPTPWTQVLFRILTLTVGRYNANLTRSLLQKLLITGKPTTPYRFLRTLKFEGEKVFVEDRIDANLELERLSCGSDATSIYVANSNVYQESVLCEWHHADLNKLDVVDGQRVWRRTYSRSRPKDAGECVSVDDLDSGT